MKRKLLSAICILSAAAAMLCGCNEGQTGGGQHLNDGPDTRIVEERGEDNGGETTPALPEGTGEIKPPRPPEGWRKPKHIFGERRGHRCPDCPEKPGDEAPLNPGAPEGYN